MLVGTSAAASPSPTRIADEALRAGCPAETPCFTGAWEFVSGRDDGRYHGRSVRSFRRDASIDVAFVSSKLRVYGVTGPTGGLAILLIPKHAPVTLDFFSPVVHPHALVYTTPKLDGRKHFAVLVVAGKHDVRSRGDYVNIDRLEPLDQRIADR